MLRLAVVGGAALLILFAATPGEASKKPPPIGVEACDGWDCDGGIVCACCVTQGCWICDADCTTSTSCIPTESCSWVREKPGQTLITPALPGGGALAPVTTPKPPVPAQTPDLGAHK